jgi:predicted permease
MTNKTVSKDIYIWAHFGVIMFHVIIGTILILISSYWNFEIRKIKYICRVLGTILVIVSALAMVPIFNEYSKTTGVIILKN